MQRPQTNNREPRSDFAALTARSGRYVPRRSAGAAKKNPAGRNSQYVPHPGGLQPITVHTGGVTIAVAPCRIRRHILASLVLDRPAIRNGRTRTVAVPLIPTYPLIVDSLRQQPLEPTVKIGHGWRRDTRARPPAARSRCTTRRRQSMSRLPLRSPGTREIPPAPPGVPVRPAGPCGVASRAIGRCAELRRSAPPVGLPPTSPGSAEHLAPNAAAIRAPPQT